MSKNKNICPKCEALMGDFYESQEKIVAPYGVVKDYTEQVSSCDECGYEINDDMDGSRYRELYEKSVSGSISTILNLLRQVGYSMIATERILGLPFRTLSRWKTSGRPSASGTALLRFLATFPWMLEIADNNFEEEFAKNLLMVEGGKIFNEKLTRSNVGITSSSPDSSTLMVNFHRNQQNDPLMSANSLLDTYEVPTTLTAVSAAVV